MSAGEALTPQGQDPIDNCLVSGVRAASRSRRAVGHAFAALGPEAPKPARHDLCRHAICSRGTDLRKAALHHRLRHLLSAQRRQTRILVDVHSTLRKCAGDNGKKGHSSGFQSRKPVEKLMPTGRTSPDGLILKAVLSFSSTWRGRCSPCRPAFAFSAAATRQSEPSDTRRVLRLGDMVKGSMPSGGASLRRRAAATIDSAGDVWMP